MSGFRDHFSAVAADYKSFRPLYPDALFDHLVSLAPGRDLAWDAATGSGQAALPLARHFRRVVATDASEEQIAHASPHPKVEYRVAPAERSGLPQASVDLVTVAQALHWLDLESFFAEVRRVLREDGVFAAWCYGRLTLTDPAADAIFGHFYDQTVGPFWPRERELVEEGYRSIALPFAELEAPALVIEARLSVSELAGYASTWSATRAYVRARGEDPIPQLAAELTALGAPRGGRYDVRWPLGLRLGRLGS